MPSNNGKVDFRCISCLFYDRVADLQNGNGELGRCRRYAPRPVSSYEAGAGDAYFPVVNGREDWCGEFHDEHEQSPEFR